MHVPSCDNSDVGESEMKLTSNELFKAVRLALYAGATAAVGLSAGTVFAQDAAQDQSSQKLETITVTGSNIRRVDIETANPVVTIDRAQIQKSGKLTVGDLVQQLPSIAGNAANPQVNNGGGSGVSAVSLRGLGSNRTLVLIDGQRLLNGDLNTIPANMVERIEILKDGASSVYGSDAIAGVVNFIMRSDYQGAEFTGDYGISDRDDGKRKGASFTFGQTSEHGSIAAGINYNKFDAVSAGHRDFSNQSLYLYYGAVQALGSSRTPYDRVNLPANLATQFGCGSVTRLPGTTGSSLADYRCFRSSANANGPSDRYNYQPLNVILTPQERTSLFALGTYKLTDNVSAYFKAFVNKTTSSSLIAPYPLDANSNGLTISKDSLYNPFGTNLGFNPDPNAASFPNFQTRLTGVGQRITTASTRSDQLIAGLKGTVGDSSWTWDANLNYGHFSQSAYTTGLLDFGKLRNSVGPSMLVNGVPTCVGTAGDPTTAIAGCVPLNVFAQNDPASVAAFKAAASNPFSQATTVSREANVDASGELFNLPAGAVSLAVGALYRKEFTNNKVDSTIFINPLTGRCPLGSQCASPLAGNISTKEVFAEVLIPILKDIPFAHSLTVDIGSRYSEFSLAGNTSNSKVAIEWRPIQDLLLRGTVSQVFRSPSIGELFRGNANDAATAQDPCRGYTQGSAGGIHDGACGASTGATNIPPGGIGPQPNSQINGIASGAVAAGFSLKPEHGKSFDFGAVYDPSWLEGLSVNADMYRIYLTDTITGITSQNVLNLCYNNAASPYCHFITRFQNGDLNQVKEPTVNLGRLDTKGVDVGFRYKVPEFGMVPGRFAVGVDATYITRFDNNPAPGTDVATVANAGQYTRQFGSFPRVRALGSLDWTFGAFQANWTARYIGNEDIGNANLAQGQSADGGIPGTVRRIGAQTYHNLTFGYTLEAINTQFLVGVDNAFDKQPPFFYQNVVVNANTDVRTYDTVGRFYFGRVIVKF